MKQIIVKARVNIKQMQFLTVFLLSAVIISSCGFHLRGDIVLPPLYERVHIVSMGNADVANKLTEALRNVGSKIVSSAQSATAVVTILSHGTQRKALNVGGNQIREYELQLTTEFTVQDHEGVQLAKPQKVTVLRNFQNDPNNVLGKDNEESIIRNEMLQPAVVQILRRMKAIAQ